MEIVSIAAIESCFAIFSASAVLNRQDLPDNRGPEFAEWIRAKLQEMAARPFPRSASRNALGI